MEKRVQKFLVGFALSLLVMGGFVAPAFASYSGTYNSSLSNTSYRQIANGDHSSAYNKATVSVNSGCVSPGYFYVYLPSVGQCSSVVLVSQRRTGEMTYNTQFSGSVSLYGKANHSGNATLSGSYCFNVR